MKKFIKRRRGTRIFICIDSTNYHMTERDSETIQKKKEEREKRNRTY